MRPGILVVVAVLNGLWTGATADEPLPWTQLSRSTCGVDAYLKQYPDRDGRGVVIAVLDTGVDMGVPGLDKLPDGSVKVVDVQDFSGEGDISLAPAVYNEAGDRLVHYDEDGAPVEYVLPREEGRPAGATLWFGLLKEKAFQNSVAADVNDNGTRDDVFGICVVTTNEGGDDDAIVFIDTNADRDWSDETPLRNYHVAHETFTFVREKKEQQRPKLTGAVNVFPRKRTVVVHFDDGGHGTHVAGIAAGYHINGQAEFNGIAPGARVISLKIGDNRLSGGATTTGSKKRAFEYAARYAREHHVPVVCNLSYGISSEREGYSDIDTFLDRLCRKNPYLIVCTSAGNNGPGLSSVGTPAAAAAVISIAALIAVDTARDVMGARIEHPQVTTFSSRGGELNKPDIATPGYATSTVPLWNRSGDFFAGTSMASPYAAGLAALLVCDARSESPDTSVRSTQVKAALRQSATVPPGFGVLDCGAGIPDVTRAAAALREGLTRATAGPLFRYTVSTESPIAVDGTGPTAYWRSRYFPVDRPQVFTIKPVFAPTVDTAARRSFTRRYTLRSTVPWCRLDQTQIYFRSEQSARVRVSYDAKLLGHPGLFVGEVEMLDGKQVVLRLINTVVVPDTFDADNTYRRTYADQTTHGWHPTRYFLNVPTGATALHLEIKAVEGKASTASVRSVFRPSGNQIRCRSLRLDTKEGRMSADYDVTDELEPGVWEVCVTSRRPDEESAYTLGVRFDGLAASPTPIEHWSHGPGQAPSGKVTFTNVFGRPLPARMTGRLEGYRKTFTKKLTPDKDTVTIPVRFEEAVRAVRIRCDTSEEDFAMFTDVAINLFDPSGKSIMQQGMDDRHFRGEATSPGGAKSCKLDIKAAFTWPDSDQSASFDVVVDYLYRDPVAISLKRGGSTQPTLYPDIAAPVDFKLQSTPPDAPDGTHYVGYLRVADRTDGHVAADILIDVPGQ